MKDSVAKFAQPIIVGILVALLTATATTLYRHEMLILSNNRAIEKQRVKDYRQYRDYLRQEVRRSGQLVAALDAILEKDPDAIPGGSLILRQRQEQLLEYKQLLENYVEENKHQGEDG